MEKSLAEGPGAGNGLPSLAASFSPVPISKSSSPREQLPGVGPCGGVERPRGSEAARGWGRPLGAKAPARSRERKLLSLQVQEVSSQVLTHNNSERGEECGAGTGKEKGKAGVVVLRNQRPRDAWLHAGPAPGLGGRGSGARR